MDSELYYKKIEIPGIDTSELKTLSEKEKTELLERIRNGDKKAREQMIMGNLRLVLSVMQRFTSKTDSPEDLFQVGCIGLMKSIDNFDPSHNVRFSTYAVPMIIGEIRRYLRDNNPIRVSRSIRDTAYRALQIKEQLTNENQREPTFAEIAEYMNIPERNITLALEAVSDPISLYDPVYSDDGDTIYVMDQLGDNFSDAELLDEILVKKAIRELGDREKKILSLRFMNGMTQTEVAKEMGISQAQVSRIEKGAMQKIKSHHNY